MTDTEDTPMGYTQADQIRNMAEDIVHKDEKITAMRKIIGQQNQLLKRYRQMKNTTTIIGWKGNDQIEFTESEKMWLITEHRKDGPEDVPKAINHRVKKIYVEIMLFILEGFGKEKWIEYADIVSVIISHYKLDVSVDGFNGGTNRSRNYFPKYYWPIKILESQDIVEYHKKGKVYLNLVKEKKQIPYNPCLECDDYLIECSKDKGWKCGPD